MKAAREKVSSMAHVQISFQIKEVQFWGHGSPGRAWIGQDCFDSTSLAQPHWQNLKNMMADGSLWWWRTCSSLHGEGIDFFFNCSHQD